MNKPPSLKLRHLWPVGDLQQAAQTRENEIARLSQVMATFTGSELDEIITAIDTDTPTPTFWRYVEAMGQFSEPTIAERNRRLALELG